MRGKKKHLLIMLLTFLMTIGGVTGAAFADEPHNDSHRIHTFAQSSGYELGYYCMEHCSTYLRTYYLFLRLDTDDPNLKKFAYDGQQHGLKVDLEDDEMGIVE